MSYVKAINNTVHYFLPWHEEQFCVFAVGTNVITESGHQVAALMKVQITQHTTYIQISILFIQAINELSCG